ncbi:MAG TPA: epoxyqueuosine reductase QueH [Spirochaetota bacterium]|nr:epoxyqueuosine reductase QueH [Spirochaetota bacterium]HRZ27512.1 epoxyqueuosine reductase QueH [Spirochaetota bacterium]HSA15709.1 epoxyqueuosine reductase QueH [Spirochaetota bacterium]
MHTCCAPCSSAVFELLNKDFNVTSYYYNPNISPQNEYRRRFGELERFAKTAGMPLIQGSYDIREWVKEVKEHRFMGERSPRCAACFMFRLRETFKKASLEGYDIVATVLSISPHKDAAVINRIGEQLQDIYGIEFLKADFKKNNGYKRSLELSREYGFYRQDYCGCVYSLMERKKDPYWLAKLSSQADISAVYR